MAGKNLIATVQAFLLPQVAVLTAPAERLYKCEWVIAAVHAMVVTFVLSFIRQDWRNYFM